MVSHKHTFFFSDRSRGTLHPVLLKIPSREKEVRTEVGRAKKW